MGAINSFKFGVKYTDHERDVDITYGQTRGLLSADRMRWRALQPGVRRG